MHNPMVIQQSIKTIRKHKSIVNLKVNLKRSRYKTTNGLKVQIPDLNSRIRCNSSHENLAVQIYTERFCITVPTQYTMSCKQIKNHKNG